jgi:hypothetical protein
LILPAASAPNTAAATPGVQRREGARRDARHAQHAVAGDGDQRLAAGRGERLHRVPPRADPLGDLGAGGVGVGERTDEDGDSPPRLRNQRPRVEHLGAVVGQLGRLAGVELRDDPRVGHHPRIGGEQTRHVLPERDPLRAEGAAEQRGGEVGAPPAQRRELAFGRRADEAGHHRDDAPLEQRQQGALDAPVGARVVG